MPLKAPNELYYTPAEVQAILSINEPALRSLVMRDKLHRIIPPGKKQALFLRSEVDAFVTEWQAFLAGRPFLYRWRRGRCQTGCSLHLGRARRPLSELPSRASHAPDRRRGRYRGHSVRARHFLCRARYRQAIWGISLATRRTGLSAYATPHARWLVSGQGTTCRSLRMRPALCQ
jgi:hypothetical protein